MIGNLIAVVLAHVRSGAAAGHVPWGLWISLVTVLLLFFNG